MVIVPNYFYMGYVWQPNPVKYVTAKAILLFLLLFLNYFKKHSSFLFSIFLLLIFFFYIPNSILFSLSNYPFAPFWSNVFFVLTFLLTPLIKFKIPQTTTHPFIRSVVVLLIPILAILPIVYSFKLTINPKTLLLNEIYLTRQEFSKKIAGFNNYLYNFLVKTFIPVGIVYFLTIKRLSLAFLLSILLLYLYLISGNKIVYLTTILLILFFYAGKSFETKLSNFLLIILAVLILFPLVDSYCLTEPILTGTFVNRFLFIPALLTQDYFDFFKGNPLYFAETHFLNFFSQSPYNKPVGFLISELYFNAPDSFANNGIVSDGYMNLGYIGVVLFSLFFAFLFSLFNSFKLHTGYFGLFFSYIYIMLSAPLFTCLITGGIFLFISYCFTLLNNSSQPITD
jgi:hypothetical protein